MEYCDYCINGNSCIHCYYNFYFNNYTKKCEKCPENCASCSNGNSCDKCIGFYDYDGGKCTCNLLGNCYRIFVYVTTHFRTMGNTLCTNGYFVDQNNVCRPCLPGCQACSSTTVCTNCFDGFCLKGDTCYNQTEGLCRISKMDDILCINGYFKDQNGICTPCLQGCQACTSATICTECFDNFCLNGVTCYDQNEGLCNFAKLFIIQLLIISLF